ncbi:MAG TPA: uridine diphosphate-N-acetylglucosamine-binding protein YvcK [Clostridia bacterium]|nr:uridine diphosphate-N-acetylglucosamine-binding protein YvcK [Clostridia bacterium]
MSSKNKMNGFLKWFRKGAKLKRWMLLILIGVASTCYAVAEIITMPALSIIGVLKVIASFVFGFLAIVVGIVFIQKRTLELLVKDSDQREDDHVKSLIFNKKVYNQGPKIVVIGGGSGLNTVLKGLKKYTDNITAIVTVSDYGEKSTDSRKLLQTLPLDDIKESLVALSSNDELMEDILNYEFTDGKLASLSLGDIYLLAMQKYYNDFPKGVEATREILNITGKVLPVTMEPIQICAELEDGTIIESRDKIADIVGKKKSKINRIFISPTNCRPAPGVIESIQEADAIIIGPGKLYTNIIPNLLVKGVTRAIKESKGFKVYISNIMTDPGQTDDFKLSDHLKAINDHTGNIGILDYCIYDTGDIVPEYIRRYNKEGADLVEQDVSKSKELGINLIKRDLATSDGEFIRHNSDAIASSIIELICEDLKFQDKQNDPQYLILHNRLKSINKKIDKTNVKKEKKKRNTNSKNKKKSKFLNKYEERMDSIKQSDEKTKKHKEHHIFGSKNKDANKASTKKTNNNIFGTKQKSKINGSNISNSDKTNKSVNSREDKNKYNNFEKNIIKQRTKSAILENKGTVRNSILKNDLNDTELKPSRKPSSPVVKRGSQLLSTDRKNINKID